MLGAIAGDVLGSVYEHVPTKHKDFRLFHELDRPTDDTVLSLAVARAIMNAAEAGRAPDYADYEKELRGFGLRYPEAGYGGSFRKWMYAPKSVPYGSFGNGSAMRAGAIGWAFADEESVVRQAELSALPTHGHPEGVKGAIAVALAVFLARSGASKDELRSAIAMRTGYALNRSLDEIRMDYKFEISCQASVPQALIAFFESADWEDAVRNAISLGGDADTQACIAGAVAEAYYGGVPPMILAWVLPKLEADLLGTLSAFAGNNLPETSAAAVAAETAARVLPRGSTAVARTRGGSGLASVREPMVRRVAGYRVVLHASVWARLGDYTGSLADGSARAGAWLRKALDELPVPRPDTIWLLSALLATKQPRIFAESEVVGDGSDWTRQELGLLGDIGVAVPVTVFDDGSHSNPRVHEQPFGATLLFSAGALLASDHGEPADSQVAPGGCIDTAAYLQLCERRLLPLLMHASSVSVAAGRLALVTVPGLGCGQFAGPFRGSMGPLLRDALVSMLGRHAASLPGIRAVRFDPYGECVNERFDFGGLTFLVRPRAVNERNGTGLGLPQLLPPRDYEEPGDDYRNCELFSVVAWDHVSWPGNDYWAGMRCTDDGVKAAATDAMFALSGVRGSYDPKACAYLPPPGVRVWEDLVLEHRLRLQAVDKVTLVNQPA